MQKNFVINSLEDTANLAKKIAKVIVADFIITLNGNLGAGKTTLVRNILHSLGVSGTVKSPTFTLVEPYQTAIGNLYHFDLYRFNDPIEWFYAGFDEYFLETNICFIEWAEKADKLIPRIDWQINIIFENNQRNLSITTLTKTGELCLNQLISNAVI